MDVNPDFTSGGFDEVPKYTSYVRLNPFGSLSCHSNIVFVETLVCPIEGNGFDGVFGVGFAFVVNEYIGPDVEPAEFLATIRQ